VTAMGLLRWVQRRRREAQWRHRVLEARGTQCRAAWCVRMTDVHAVPLVPHGGTFHPANGLPLCRRHRELKADGLLVDPSWLDADQVEWLADEGHVEWLLDGVTVGRHRRLFADGPDRRGHLPLTVR
jgi:hypothetical protein